jgi:hypothetical protein
MFLTGNGAWVASAGGKWKMQHLPGILLKHIGKNYLLCLATQFMQFEVCYKIHAY